MKSGIQTEQDKYIQGLELLNQLKKNMEKPVVEQPPKAAPTSSTFNALLATSKAKNPSSGLLMLLAQCYEEGLDTTCDPEAAFECLSQALTIESTPSTPETRGSEKSREIFEKLLNVSKKCKPSSEMLNTIGKFYDLEFGPKYNYSAELAHDYYKAAIGANSRNASAWLNLGARYRGGIGTRSPSNWKIANACHKRADDIERDEAKEAKALKKQKPN